MVSQLCFSMLLVGFCAVLVCFSMLLVFFLCGHSMLLCAFSMLLCGVQDALELLNALLPYLYVYMIAWSQRVVLLSEIFYSNMPNVLLLVSASVPYALVL